MTNRVIINKTCCIEEKKITVGDLFSIEGDVCILSITGEEAYNFISLEDGRRLSYPSSSISTLLQRHPLAVRIENKITIIPHDNI